jgi:hypothetical protein
MRARRTLVAALAVLALGGPAAGLAEAQPNTGGGGGGATCTYKDGSKAKPGDQMTHRAVTRVKGRRFVSYSTFICGEDGQWHYVL